MSSPPTSRQPGSSQVIHTLLLQDKRCFKQACPENWHATHVLLWCSCTYQNPGGSSGWDPACPQPRPCLHPSRSCPHAAELLQLLGLLLLFPAMGLAASASAAAADARSALAPDVPRLRSDGAAWGGRDAGAGGPLFSRLLALAGAAQLGLGTPRRQPAGEGSGAGRHGGLADSDVEEEPLLFSHSAPVGEWPPATPSPPAPAREPGRPPPAAGGAALPWRAIALPLLCELGVACFELACCRPAAVATLLCACSLIQPSAIGGGALVVGLSALLSQARGTAPALQRHSRPVCAALLLWALGCYIGTAVAPAAGSSQLLEALGLHAFQQEREQGVAGAPLLAMLVAAAAAGGLARAGSGGGNTSR